MGAVPLEGFTSFPNLDIKTIARLFSKVEIDHETGCWNWTSTLTETGYGKFHYGGRRGKHYRVHRFMYAWLVGPVPNGFGGVEFDHFVCNNRRCCNPFHIKLVTHAENSHRTMREYCKRGHLMAPSRIFSNNHRGCITCERDRATRNRHKHRASLVNPS